MANTIFELSKYVALLGWGLLVLSLFAPGTRRFAWPIAQFVLPAALCLLYLVMVWAGRHDLHLPNSFTELEGIGRLYLNENALTASWLHFLSLDLFAGAWIVRDGVSRGISVWLVLVCLPFVLIFAPAGLLLYFIVRLMHSRRADGSGA